MRSLVLLVCLVLALGADAHAAIAPVPSDCCLPRGGEDSNDVSLQCPNGAALPCVTPTPSGTKTITSTRTQTPTPTSTPLATATGTPTSTFTITPTFTNTPAAMAATNWCPSMTACWEMEENSGASRLNDLASSCGASCDLADHGTVGKDTTNKVIGTASGSYAAASQFLDCAIGSTCAALNAGGTATWGCYARNTTGADNPLLSGGGASGDKDNYRMLRDSATTSLKCSVTTGGTLTSSSTSIATWLGSGFNTAICAFDDTANTLTPYFNGVLLTAAVTVNSMDSATTANFKIGSRADATEFAEGNIDECFVDVGCKWSAAESCRATWCGVNGSLCTCDSGTPANYSTTGRSAFYACTPVPCNAAAPCAAATGTPTPSSTPTRTPTATPTTASVICGSSAVPAFSLDTLANIPAGSPACTTGANAGGYRIDTVNAYVTTAAGNLICAPYTVNGSNTTATIVNAACLPAAGASASVGYQGFAPTTPASCIAPANTAIWVLCNTDANGLAYGQSVNTGFGSVIHTSASYPALTSPLSVSLSEGTFASYLMVTAQ